MPPVGALGQLRAANGDQGVFERARSNPLLLVGIVAGALLLLAWIGWAIYVTSSNGATAGLGVVIAWPAMLAALALISLPFIGGYLLVKRLTPADAKATAAADARTSDEENEGSDDEPDDSAEEEDEGAADSEGDEHSDEDEDAEQGEESDDEDEEESEPEAKASSKKG